MTMPIDGEKVRCDRCKHECYDFRKTVADERICIMCVQTELEGRIEELERTKRVMATNEGQLHARLAQEQTTVVGIEHVCLERGYDPESGEFVADWIKARLDELEWALRGES